MKSLPAKLSEKPLSEIIEHVIQILKAYIQDNSLDDLTENRVEYCCEQIELLSHLIQKGKHSLRYSTNLIAISYLLYFSSPVAYRILKSSNIIILPSIRHLQTLTNSVSKSGINKYLSTRIRSLNQFQRYVVLIIDEIYVSQKLEMAGGYIFGFDKENMKPARTALSL